MRTPTAGELIELGDRYRDKERRALRLRSAVLAREYAHLAFACEVAANMLNLVAVAMQPGAHVIADQVADQVAERIAAERRLTP